MGLILHAVSGPRVHPHIFFGLETFIPTPLAEWEKAIYRTIELDREWNEFRFWIEVRNDLLRVAAAIAISTPTGDTLGAMLSPESGELAAYAMSLFKVVFRPVMYLAIRIPS